jgi:uncharacterized DUF497 family protein
MRQAGMDFEWDDNKERKNIEKHSVSFKAAQFVFKDYARIERYDDDHSTSEEERWQTIGFAAEVLFVVYTERRDKIHLISARAANPFERRIYYGDSTKYPEGWRRVNP